MTTTATGGSGELLFKRSDVSEQPFDWANGRQAARFLNELRDNTIILGSQCPSCQAVYLPPREVCGPCFAATTAMIPVANEGVIIAACIVRFKFIDPETGEVKPVPYGNVFVRLDGATTALSHLMSIGSPEEESFVRPGQRVRAVFAEKRTGTLLDIERFEAIRGTSEGMQPNG